MKYMNNLYNYNEAKEQCKQVKADPLNETNFIEKCTINCEKYDSSKCITEELLLENNWKQCYSSLGNCFTKSIDNNAYHLEISKISNTWGRNWSIHVDNCDFQSIGGCDIQTIKHFNDFMKILEISYELH